RRWLAPIAVRQNEDHHRSTSARMITQPCRKDTVTERRSRSYSGRHTILPISYTGKRHLPKSERVGRIDRSYLGLIGFGVIGSTPPGSMPTPTLPTSDPAPSLSGA